MLINRQVIKVEPPDWIPALPKCQESEHLLRFSLESLAFVIPWELIFTPPGQTASDLQGYSAVQAKGCVNSETAYIWDFFSIQTPFQS